MQYTYYNSKMIECRNCVYVWIVMLVMLHRTLQQINSLGLYGLVENWFAEESLLIEVVKGEV